MNTKTLKVGRNDPCPCGSTKKFKACCSGKVDWAEAERLPPRDASRLLTIRGKNLQFIGNLLKQLPPPLVENASDWTDFKARITPEFVEFAHRGVADLWPDEEDYRRALTAEKESTTALYTGSFEPDQLFRAINRLSLYCDQILLIDPFQRPGILRRDVDPVAHPELHRASTLRNLYIWIRLWPWMSAGIVSFIRPPYDFNPGLWDEAARIQEERVKRNPKLKDYYDRDVADHMARVSPMDGGYGENFALSLPDEKLRELLHSSGREPFASDEEFFEFINHRRDTHPYFMRRLAGQRGEVFIESSGASYEISKRICRLTDSHIATDMTSRWKELEVDREEAGIDLAGWSPLAKALSETKFRALEGVSLDSALQLRKENRLESMRNFLRKVWKSCRSPNEFSETNAAELAGELEHEVAVAKTEWAKIDAELLNWAAGSVAPFLASTTVGFVPTAITAIVGGAVGLAKAHIHRKNFHATHPAGFFLGKTQGP